MVKALKTDIESQRYERQFWKLAGRHLPHHALLTLSVHARIPHLTSALGERRDKILRKSVIKAYPAQAVDEYQRVISSTKLWHGTGRYQHTGPEITDTLIGILKHGGLMPARDVYAVILGGDEMVSISTTRLRIIARSYADMHGKGEQEKYRYGSSLWWVAYYYGLFYGIVFTRYSILLLRNLSRWNDLSRNQSGEREWGKKVHKKAQSVWSAFGHGSDIPDNYPVLFGIKRHSEPVDIPKAVRFVEVRLLDPIQMSDLSHLEVPHDKVSEIQKLLAQNNYSIPVFPIELGEYVASKQSFAALLDLQ